MGTDWARVKQVLAEAAARTSAAERTTYLAEACSGDDSLRAEVDKLLRAHDSAGAFLEQRVVPPAEEVSAEKPGDQLGPYTLVELIGEGGCGTVYLAQQGQPIRRTVALKVIKLGMDTRAVITRFEAERQALALMDHPNIARVLDAGATGAGRPYFVMELVRGTKITDYCDQNQLSTEERLKLFIQICHALQHAHQKGIIHRDIKPSNILVTTQNEAPTPKVIDFGIAKATGPQLTERTLFTACEQFIGTPAYMSPEQAHLGVVDIDTRSDIYALGVLLYELLTGQTPFDLRKLTSAGLDEARRIVREEEPKRPSTRLAMLGGADRTTAAQRRQTEPAQLVHLLRGDLDWIVMRCLEKDRTRRYETANSLAEDVERYLRNEPLTARPPSRWYWFQKLVQRNKMGFAAAAVVTLALVLGLGFSLWMLARERTARQQALLAEQKAQAESAKSQQVARLLKDMLQGVGPSVALGRDITMLREILDKTADRVGTALKDQPEVEAELRTTLGEVYQALGQYDQAEGMYREALRLRRALWGNMHTKVADSLDILGHELRSCRGEAVESASLLEGALMIRTNLLGPEHVLVAASLHHLGGVYFYEGELSEAADLFERALAMRRRLLGNEHPEVADSLVLLADTKRYMLRPAEAEICAREALAILSGLSPTDNAGPMLASAREALGGALREQGKLEEALTLYTDLVTVRRKLLADDHPDIASALYNVGMTLMQMNRLAEAEAYFREALTICRKTVGEKHTLTAFCLERLADVQQRTGRLAEAELASREALELWKPRENHHVRRVRSYLIVLLRTQRKFTEASAVLSEATAEAAEALQAARKTSPSEPEMQASLRFVELLCCQGRLGEAERMMQQVISAAASLPPSPSLVNGVALQSARLATLQVWYGRDAQYGALSRQVLEWAAIQPRLGPKRLAAIIAALRPTIDPRVQAEALELAREALNGAPANSSLCSYQLAFGMAAYRTGDYLEAQRALREAEVRGFGGPQIGPWSGVSPLFQVMVLFRQNQPEAARQLLAAVESRIPPLPDDVQQAVAEGAECDTLTVWLACKEARALLTPPTE